ncbi:inositol monophosphatase 2-like [Anopheles nili]|uniref:inositol monophosphatase 2-like n=1 Tax=Anopheles nili TaxID=185578 RepID=UPI00237C4784|nr:inositol monophosphatase 2-like [Anopheles nili]
MGDEREIKDAFDAAVALVKQCSEIIVDGYRTASMRVEVKGKHWDLVTEYDQRVEDVLITGLRKRFPHHRFCAEESSFASGEQVKLSSDPTWIIDPIDGTVNFVRGIPFTCISVALAVNGELQIGIISNPSNNELYTAIKGQGSFLNGRRIKTRATEQLKDALVGHEFSIGSYLPIRAALFERGQRFIAECLGLRAFGSAALSLAYIASGQIDAYSIQYLKPWDIAAGALLIQEAGGTVTNITGGKYDIMKPDIVAASSKSLAMQILQIVREVDNDLKQLEQM